MDSGPTPGSGPRPQGSGTAHQLAQQGPSTTKLIGQAVVPTGLPAPVALAPGPFEGTMLQQGPFEGMVLHQGPFEAPTSQPQASFQPEKAEKPLIGSFEAQNSQPRAICPSDHQEKFLTGPFEAPAGQIVPFEAGIGTTAPTFGVSRSCAPKLPEIPGLSPPGEENFLELQATGFHGSRGGFHGEMSLSPEIGAEKGALVFVARSPTEKDEKEHELRGMGGGQPREARERLPIFSPPPFHKRPHPATPTSVERGGKFLEILAEEDANEVVFESMARRLEERQEFIRKMLEAQPVVLDSGLLQAQYPPLPPPPPSSLGPEGPTGSAWRAEGPPVAMQALPAPEPAVEEMGGGGGPDVMESDAFPWSLEQCYGYLESQIAQTQEVVEGIMAREAAKFADEVRAVKLEFLERLMVQVEEQRASAVGGTSAMNVINEKISEAIGICDDEVDKKFWSLERRMDQNMQGIVANFDKKLHEFQAHVAHEMGVRDRAWALQVQKNSEQEPERFQKMEQKCNV